MRLAARLHRQPRTFDRHASERTCFDTPVLRELLGRSTVVRFPSGGIWLFTGPACGFFADTLLEAAEAALREETRYQRNAR